MHRGNFALLRLAFLAAIVCAVLRAATFGGVDRGAPSGRKVGEMRPIPLRSILSISDERPNERVRDGGGRGAG